MNRAQRLASLVLLGARAVVHARLRTLDRSIGFEHRDVARDELGGSVRRSVPVAASVATFGESVLLANAFFVGATSLALIPIFHNVIALGLISFVFGFGMGAGQPIVIMLMYTNSRDGRSGESLGLKFMTNQLTKLVSPIVFGAIASGLGLVAMFWINALVLTAGGALSRARTKRPASAPEPVD